MNRYGLICRCILESPAVTQRDLAQELDVSLGTVNNLVKECISLNLISFDPDTNSYRLTGEGQDLLEPFRVDGALIIAAGFGSRFVPLTFETPKGLLEVFGERMIERQIRQLHEVGITDITIAVGYLKEKFEYLIDKFGVKLLYNPEYSCKNTLTTVRCAAKILEGRNMYLLSSDNWMRHNMFHTFECGAWYASIYKEGAVSEWCLDFNKKGRILNVEVGGFDRWFMYGPVFFSRDYSMDFLPVLEAYYQLPGTEQFYWEQVYMEILNGDAAKRLKEAGIVDQKLLNNDIEMYVNRQREDEIYEFENLEELRQFDPKYQNHSDNEALELVSKVFQVPESKIHNIRCLKAGMTNKSFLFELEGRHYICRIPGPGTELLINRGEEKTVYDTVLPLGITEQIIYLSGETGYKISEYYEGVRTADSENWNDMARCMAVVRKLHSASLTVGHAFDLRERISFYEKLCRSCGSILFEDYEPVKQWMLLLLDSLDVLDRPYILSHLDSNVDNFLILPDGNIKLIDWEYAGMCDPLVDISMCAIYSYYNEEEANRLLSVYLERDATEEEQFVCFSYMALGGFLWALWAVYKSAIGEEFGEYTLIMYRYAKNYFRHIKGGALGRFLIPDHASAKENDLRQN